MKRRSTMMEEARTSETSVDNYFTRQYIPEDNSELHTRGCENLKSHISDHLVQVYQLNLCTHFLSPVLSRSVSLVKFQVSECVCTATAAGTTHSNGVTSVLEGTIIGKKLKTCSDCGRGSHTERAWL
jgi:hypothetical protein